jgi:hypothetical protein
MVEVERSNPHWGLDLVSHFGRAGVATRFANYENVSRTDGQLLISHGKVYTVSGNLPSIGVIPQWGNTPERWEFRTRGNSLRIVTRAKW